MKNSLSTCLLLSIFILTSCFEQKKKDPQNEKKEQITTSCIEPYLYLDDFKKSNIPLECFDLNEISIPDKNSFIYGYHYFCDQKNAETGGSSEVFANGLVKINTKLEILEPLMTYGTDNYYINERYIIKAFNGSQVYEKGNPKIEITVFDLKKKTQSTSTFYFSWFCEA
jgi:hypothetical protein